MIVIFNNVSYQNQEGTNEETEILKKERIDSYKLALENVAIQFYKIDLSDQTMLGEKSWKELKTDVC